MSYHESYLRLVRDADLGRVWEALLETGVPALYGLANLRRADDEDGFPYLICDQEEPPTGPLTYSAMQLGALVELGALANGKNGGRFYLPIVVVVADVDESLVGNRRIELKHELLHVKDLIARIEADPGYIDRSSELALTNLDSAARLPESIDFEIEKRVYFETRAYSMEYAEGFRTHRIPSEGSVILYECSKLEEYLEVAMASEISNLARAYMKKFPTEFPGHSVALHKHFDAALQSHARGVLGDDVSLVKILIRMLAFYRGLEGSTVSTG